MRRGGVVLAVALALVAPVAGGCGRLPDFGSSVTRVMTFADAPLWDDGRAEVATYTGTTLRYGLERPTTARLIVVKEDLLASSWVKSDSGPLPGRTVEALKMNLIADFPTGTYAYHWMASVFVRRDDLAPIKEVMSSTEGCGITFVRVGPKDGRLVHEAHSYWEGEADRERPVTFPRGLALWADALPLVLRRWADGRPPFEERVWLLPSQIGSRSPDSSAVPVAATVRLVGTTPLIVPDGPHEARHLTVTTPRGTDLYWFDSDAPHVLLKMETADGRRLELVNVVRLDYWHHTAPGEERLLLE